MNTEQFDGHTPGPWDADYGPIVATLDEGDSTDVLTIRVPTSEDDDVAWTNQLLAAAAPDLLAEVKRLRGILGDIVAIDEWGGDGKDVGITITYGDGYTFTGWLNKCYDEVVE